MNLKFIYKICKVSEWLEAKKNKKFIGTDKDKSDGYIHFSSIDQVKSTLEKYYSNEKELILLKVKTINLEILYQYSILKDKKFNINSILSNYGTKYFATKNKT